MCTKSDAKVLIRGIQEGPTTCRHCDDPDGVSSCSDDGNRNEGAEESVEPAFECAHYQTGQEHGAASAAKMIKNATLVDVCLEELTGVVGQSLVTSTVITIFLGCAKSDPKSLGIFERFHPVKAFDGLNLSPRIPGRLRPIQQINSGFAPS